MKTVILDTPGQFRFDTTEAPAQITDGEALVRVRRVGICGTDLHAFRGRQPFFQYPRILGHELGVEIVEVGENAAGLRAGDLCAVEPYLNCGHCIACRKGKTNCCTSLQVLGVHTDGGMRELIKVPTHKLHSSKTLTLEQLALVETLGIGAHAVDRAKITPGEFTLVIGAGPIGLSVMQFALQAGAQVITMDVNEARLAFCREQLGVQRTIVAGEDALAQIEEITSRDLPTVVFDATGNAASMMQSFQYVSHGGRLVFVGLFQGEVTFNDPFFHRREMTLLSSRNSTSADFKRIIQLMERGEINTTPWVTHRCELEGMIGQFPSWLEPETGVIKAMVEI